MDVYILDYLTKRKLIASAKVFEDEAKVPLNVRGKTRYIFYKTKFIFLAFILSLFKH